MFGDIGWAELVLIGIVALIVIGPEDLPEMFRQLGRFTAKLRQMSREFSRAMEQAAKDSGVKDVANDLRAVTSPTSLGLNKVKEAADRFEKWDPIKNAAKPTAIKPLTPAPMPPTPIIPAAAAPAVAEAVEPVTVAAAAEPQAEAAAAAPAVVHGPETQALLDKQAAKRAIVKETAEKLKAVEQGPAADPTTPVEKPVAKPRVRKAAPAEAAAEPGEAPAAPKPRAPRRTKKVDEA